MKHILYDDDNNIIEEFETIEEKENNENEENIGVFDLYAIQLLCDGFGNDTITIKLFRTLEEAQKEYDDMILDGYRTWQLKIVGQMFGQTYVNGFAF